MHEVPIDLAKATTMAPSVDDGSAGWTTPGRIPEAAVEAAAKAQYGHDGLAWDDGMVPDWECEDDSLQDSYRTGARVALEAAAPHMYAACGRADFGQHHDDDEGHVHADRTNKSPALDDEEHEPVYDFSNDPVTNAEALLYYDAEDEK